MLAVALGGTAQLGAAVLCVGTDGHAGVEYSFGGCCSSTAASVDQVTADSVFSGSPLCGACVDLQISSPRLKDEKTHFLTPEAGVEEVFMQSRVGGFCGHDLIPFERPANHSEVHAALSTVVLLI